MCHFGSHLDSGATITESGLSGFRLSVVGVGPADILKGNIGQ